MHAYERTTVMTDRLAFRTIAPEVQRGFTQAGRDAIAGGLEPRLKHLTDIRASQMNGCAFCLDLHVNEWKEGGDAEERLHFVAVWREAGDIFSPREKAALAWTEAVTDLIGQDHVPDDVYEHVRQHFTDKELIHLTASIAAINAHNRMNIAFRTPVGATRKPKPAAAHV
jgi:AhpD family alkylhydroperoxidase